MTFVMDKVALRQVYLRVFGFSPVSAIPPLHHTHLNLHIALNKGQTGKAWEPLKGYRGALDIKVDQPRIDMAPWRL